MIKVVGIAACAGFVVLILASTGCSPAVLPDVADSAGAEIDTASEVDAAPDAANTDGGTSDSALDTAAADLPNPGTQCSNGACDGIETASSCPTDCGFLRDRYRGPCAKPGTFTGCPDSYVCVLRAPAAGGPVCTADFATWPGWTEPRPTSDFIAFDDYVVDSVTGLNWSKQSLPPMTALAALSACATQTAGGFNDWRAPTAAELAALLDRTRQHPASGVSSLNWATDELYWTAVTDLVHGGAFAQDFSLGIATLDAASLNADTEPLHPLRCVRAAGDAQLGSGDRFVKENNGLVVLDRLSGLHWQWYYSSAKMSWTEALAWCSHNTAGMPGQGWRLPTVAELMQLADRQPGKPTLTSAFANPVAASFWTATPGLKSTQAWSVGLTSAVCSPAPKSFGVLVRCVRD